MSESLAQGTNPTETLPPDSYLEPINDHLRSRLAERLLAYDSFSSDAEHLRPHQVEGVHQFKEVVRGILQGSLPNQGMSILHPTGSGKTVEAAEVIRMISDTDLNALVLVPGYRALNQTAGSGEEAGVIRNFVPQISVGEYSGKRKQVGNTVTVMNYQALRGARARGDIDVINPSIVICDEIHHVIDGKWAQDVKEVSQGRLLLGLTATPAYIDSRNIRRLFPIVLAHKTLRQGIEEGILAELRGFLYRGSSRLIVKKGGKDYSDDEIFAAIANSKDNYLAAAICAGEVAQGRKGVISCAPGFDRAHAKIMSKILQQTVVKTKEGERFIRAAYVDGETHPDVLEEIFENYKLGRLDALTYIDLLLESWDSPETEFGVMLRATRSKLLAEQRIGRIVRPFYAGKIATIHEIIYEIIGDNKPQQTHLDILEPATVTQGRLYGSSGPSGGHVRKKPLKHHYSDNIFDVDKFVVDSGLLKEMADFDPQAINDTRIIAGQEAIPFDWPTAHLLASRFGITLEETEEILESKSVGFKAQTINEIEHRYYSPRATTVMAKHLHIQPLPEGLDRPMTATDISQYLKENSYARRIPPKAVKHHMEEAGIKPTRYIAPNGQIILAYPHSTRDVPLRRLGYKKHAEEVDLLSPEVIRSSPELRVVNWLAKILVSPKEAPTPSVRQEIMTGQSCLLAAMREEKKTDPEDYDFLARDLTLAEVKPNEQMENVMKAKHLTFVELVMLASKAHAKYVALRAKPIDKRKGGRTRSV